MHKYIFPDTNIFEQFKPIEKIDWLALANCSTATLVIAPVVISELNRHKDTAERSRLRKRAAAALSGFHHYHEIGSAAEIRAKVNLEFWLIEPLIDFVAHRLDPNINDDRLIASGIHFSSEKGLSKDVVVIATGDFGMGLKAQAQACISQLTLPSGLRLPDEVDEDARKIAELEKEVQKYRASHPKLKLAFATGENFKKFKLRERKQLDASGKLYSNAEVKRRYPLMDTSTSTVALIDIFASREAKVGYNGQLMKFYFAMQKYGEERYRYQNLIHRTLKLDLRLFNEGGAPAEDVDINLHFPDGFTLVESFPGRPKKPTAPAPPQSPFNQPLSISPFLFPHLREPRFDFPTSPPNSSLISLKKTRSYDVKFKVRRVKHTFSQSLHALYVVFASCESAHSFKVECSAIAGNSPVLDKNMLHIVIDR